MVLARIGRDYLTDNEMTNEAKNTKTTQIRQLLHNTYPVTELSFKLKRHLKKQSELVKQKQFQNWGTKIVEMSDIMYMSRQILASFYHF